MPSYQPQLFIFVRRRDKLMAEKTCSKTCMWSRFAFKPKHFWLLCISVCFSLLMWNIFLYNIDTHVCLFAGFLYGSRFIAICICSFLSIRMLLIFFFHVNVILNHPFVICNGYLCLYISINIKYIHI